jgi:hypothetical protein
VVISSIIGAFFFGIVTVSWDTAPRRALMIDFGMHLEYSETVHVVLIGLDMGVLHYTAA